MDPSSLFCLWLVDRGQGSCSAFFCGNIISAEIMHSGVRVQNQAVRNVTGHFTLVC